MAFAKRILIIAGIIALLIGAAYLYSLTQVTVQQVTIDTLENVSAQGFTLKGAVIVHNGGIMPVSIRSVDYDIVRHEDILATGVVQGTHIPAGGDASFPLEAHVKWSPSAKLAADLLLRKDTSAQVNGTVHVGFVSVPFSQEFDMGPMIRQAARDAVQGALDTISGWFT